ncbi:RNA polymerase sigma factor, partial [Aestuariivirga sp.]|uniref:RNA polymerase sigma factor n=1 Tax=Aestuariivirga sp. TaxID=2650926 RepID=UPI0035938334
VPQAPEAWLLTAARRTLMKSVRHQKVAQAAEPDLVNQIEEAIDMMEAGRGDFADERLKLLFVCAHPAIDPAAQTPMMLQAVLGLDAVRIAAVFLEQPATMGQRLVRAKARIKELRIRFAVPDTHELPERLDAVLQAIYAGFTAGWEDGGPLSGEAIWLGRTVLALMPDEPEAMGLLSLMLHCEARKAARRKGGFVPLDRQDVSLWDEAMMAEADALLRAAGQIERFGRFQCEAAIQSVHAARRFTGRTDGAALTMLYAALVRLSPTLGARVGQAAVAEPEQGLGLLAQLPEKVVAAYQPFHAVKADLLKRLGREVEATAAYARAIELSPDEAVRRFLWTCMSAET